MGHTFANVDSEIQPPRLILKKQKEGRPHFIADPVEVAMLHTEPWAETWKAYSPDFDKVVAPCVRKLRTASLSEAKEISKGLDGSAKRIRNTISKFTNSTAIGADQVRLKRLASLPDVALEGLGKIFKQTVATLTIPGQELLNILTLLGKTHGGSRTIAIMASIYRAFMKHSGLTMREWDVKEGHHWDSALVGSSSLRAAILRALQSENGEARGEHVAH